MERRKKLIYGVRLLLLHPEWAARTCQSCKEFVYNRKGEIETNRTGKPVLRSLYGTPPPCHVCPKIPPGAATVPENAEELSDRNWQAYYFDQQCEAVGSWPDDPIVRRNAVIIRRLERATRDGRQEGLLEGILTVLGKARR